MPAAGLTPKGLQAFNRMPAIFRKTFKGLAELEDRTHGLTPRLRALLILVDGQRDATALRTLWSQEVRPALNELLREGYIEAAGRPRRRLPMAWREPTTVVLPPAPMADVEPEDVPGFVPAFGSDEGHVESAAGTVDLLLDDLVEVMAPGAAAALADAPVPLPAPAPTPAPAPDPAPRPAFVRTPHLPAPPSDPVLQARRRAAVQELYAEVGDDPDPQVHALALRMVRAQSADALRPLLVQATQLVARLRGRPAAEVYAMRFLA